MTPDTRLSCRLYPWVGHGAEPASKGIPRRVSHSEGTSLVSRQGAAATPSEFRLALGRVGGRSYATPSSPLIPCLWMRLTLGSSGSVDVPIA